LDEVEGRRWVFLTTSQARSKSVTSYIVGKHPQTLEEIETKEKKEEKEKKNGYVYIHPDVESSESFGNRQRGLLGPLPSIQIQNPVDHQTVDFWSFMVVHANEARLERHAHVCV
jgi:hypothetical protein